MSDTNIDALIAAADLSDRTDFRALCTDFRALCAAIDDGQDDHLPILADMLEERGDPRAAGLRSVIKLYAPCHTGVRYAAMGVARTGTTRSGSWSLDGIPGQQGVIPRDAYVRLSGGHKSAGGKYTLYTTRSRAYLALAQALTEAS